MQREAAVVFFVRLMRNLNLNTQRFSLREFPEIRQSLWQNLGFPGRNAFSPLK